MFELERREEARVAKELARFLDSPRDLASALAEVIRLVVIIEERLGSQRA